MNEFDKAYFHGKDSNFVFGYDNPISMIFLKHKFRKGIEIIKRFKETGKLCDVGCAYGYLVDLAARNGFQACGYDVSGYAIERAKQKFPGLEFGEANIGEINGRKFDVVTAFDVVEHCGDLQGVLKDIKGIMKKDGMFLCSVPCYLSEENDKDKTHHWRLSTEEWENKLNENGFSVLYSSEWPEWLLKIKKKWCVSLILATPK